MTEQLGGVRRRSRDEVKGGANYEGAGGTVTVVLLQALTLRRGDSLHVSADRDYASLHVNGRDVYLAPRRWQPDPLGMWYFDTDWEPWASTYPDGPWPERTYFGVRAMRVWDVVLPRQRRITIFASPLDLIGVAAVVAIVALGALVAWL